MQMMTAPSERGSSMPAHLKANASDATEALDATNPSGAPAARAKKRSMLVPALIVLLGIAILLYPVIATQWNNYQQAKAAHEYKSLVNDADPADIRAQLQRAHEYNAHRSVGPILDPWTSRLSPDNEPYKEYLAQLNLSDVMARVVIPSIDLDLPVYHGTQPETLDHGVGHLFGTDLPVGGASTHAVLTGHTGLQTATLFDNLTDVKVGDSIYIDVYGEKLRYVVYTTEVVLPDEADSLYKVEGKDLLTLVTCTPYGVNSHRLLVHAQRAPMDDVGNAALDSGAGIHFQWWMWLFIGIAAAGLALWLAMLRRARQHRKNLGDAHATMQQAVKQHTGQPNTQPRHLDTSHLDTSDPETSDIDMHIPHIDSAERSD
ncbi:MAG: class C sortase [Actinomycetaceae bacterium]|nr:class C sortase [Actinomycetaceae bacterium]MDY6082529.1 class C sortase [Actinomycetaceae bacterium]